MAATVRAVEVAGSRLHRLHVHVPKLKSLGVSVTHSLATARRGSTASLAKDASNYSAHEPYYIRHVHSLALSVWRPGTV